MTPLLSAPACAKPIATASAVFDPAAVIAFCLTFAAVLFLPAVLNDGDTLWQIRTGAWIIAHHAIPSIDPFSFTAGDRPWFAHEWLAETIMALAYTAGGMVGIMVLTAAASGLTVTILLHHLRQFLPGPYPVAALAIALSCAAPSMLARPHLLAWPCLALWCGGLITARTNRIAPSFALLPVMLLWVNLHGSFMFGLLLPGAFLIEALLDAHSDRRRVFTGWAAFIAASWAVALINPDFLAGVLFPIHLLGMTTLTWVGEWAPADFSRFQPLELTILAALALGLSGKLRLPPIRLLLLLGLIHGALSHIRNEQLLGIAGALILAEPIGDNLGRGRSAVLHGAWRVMAAGAALIAIAALMVRLILPLSPDRTGATFQATLDAIPAALRRQPVLNEYSLGGLLIFNGVRPFVDSRADLYGDGFLTRYHRMISPDRAELERTLSEYGIAWTIFPAQQPVVAILDRLPSWHRLSGTGDIAVHVRDGQSVR